MFNVEKMRRSQAIKKILERNSPHIQNLKKQIRAGFIKAGFIARDMDIDGPEREKRNIGMSPLEILK